MFFVSIAIVITAFNYFIDVFIERSLVAGGAQGMLDLSGEIWGIQFSGPGYDMMLRIMGADITYIIFVLLWYFIQGVFMSNQIIANFNGDAMLGAYGVDLVSAALRRIDGDWIAVRFDYLLGLDTYGFLPSAFGSLFIDFKYFSVVLVFLWGWFCGLVYLRVKSSTDFSWLIVSPFVSFGILFSLINTPIGYSNGLMTHLWLLGSFFLIRRTRIAC